jgi:hypothetical protein
MIGMQIRGTGFVWSEASMKGHNSIGVHGRLGKKRGEGALQILVDLMARTIVARDA